MAPSEAETKTMPVNASFLGVALELRIMIVEQLLPPRSENEGYILPPPSRQDPRQLYGPASDLRVHAPTSGAQISFHQWRDLQNTIHTNRKIRDEICQWIVPKLSVVCLGSFYENTRDITCFYERFSSFRGHILQNPTFGQLSLRFRVSFITNIYLTIQCAWNDAGDPGPDDILDPLSPARDQQRGFVEAINTSSSVRKIVISLHACDPGRHRPNRLSYKGLRVHLKAFERLDDRVSLTVRMQEMPLEWYHQRGRSLDHLARDQYFPFGSEDLKFREYLIKIQNGPRGSLFPLQRPVLTREWLTLRRGLYRTFMPLYDVGHIQDTGTMWDINPYDEIDPVDGRWYMPNDEDMFANLTFKCKKLVTDAWNAAEEGDAEAFDDAKTLLTCLHRELITGLTTCLSADPVPALVNPEDGFRKVHEGVGRLLL